MEIDPNAITLEQALEQRNAWLAASLALATAQEYTLQDGSSMRKLTRANLKEVNASLALWEQRVKQLSPNRRSRTRYGIV
jgi:uncharacterized protein DUF6148